MTPALAVLLRNAEHRLVQQFLVNTGAPSIDMPHPKRARTEPVAKYLLKQVEENDQLVARLDYDAGRVKALANPQFDRFFAAATTDEIEEEIADFDQRSKALWFFVHRPDDFEDIEREVSFEALSGTKDRHTKFETCANLDPDFAKAEVDALERQICYTYRVHDGSGKFVTSHPPDTDSAGGILFSIGISQPPSLLERFGEDGETADETVRKITWVHFRYEILSGALFVVTSRGGFRLRNEMAEAFGRFILKQSKPPSVARVDEVDLRPLLGFEELPAIPNQPDAKCLVTEVIVQSGRYPDTRLVLQNKAGIKRLVLDRLFGREMQLSTIYSVRVGIKDYLPEGAQKPCSFAAIFHRDGSTSFDGNRMEQRHLREQLPPLWGLKAKS